MNHIYPKRTDSDEQQDWFDRLLPWRPWCKWDENYPKIIYGSKLTVRHFKRHFHIISRRQTWI